MYIKCWAGLVDLDFGSRSRGTDVNVFEAHSQTLNCLSVIMDAFRTEESSFNMSGTSRWQENSPSLNAWPYSEGILVVLDCAVCFGSTCLLRRKSLCKSIQISSLWLITVGREWNVSILILSLNLSLFCAWAIDSFHLAISSSSYCNIMPPKNTWSNPGSPFMPAIPGVRYYKNVKMVLTYSTCTVKLVLCISWNLCPHEPGAFLPVHMTTPLTHCPHLKKHTDMSSITSSILPPLYPYQWGFSPDGNVSTITELITGTRPGVPTLKCNFLTKG